MPELYIDASDHVVGRLATQVAKSVLKGDKVVVVNAENAVISGDPETSFRIYRQKIDRGDPYHGPFYPKQPDRILRRVVRGMLPKNTKGKTALKRLKVFLSVPDELKSKQFAKVKVAENKLDCKQTTLGKLCEKLTGRSFGS